MKKILLISLLAVVVLVVVTAALIAYKLNDIVASLRPQIEKQASSFVGAPVSLGEISASIFPSAKLSVSEAKILSPDGKSSALSLGALNAAVALRPLLNKKLEISSLEIESPKITLIKDSSGTRMQGLPQSPPSQSAPPPQTAPTSPPQSGDSKSLDITLSRIAISNGEITIDDKVSRSVTSVRAINMDAGIAVRGKEIAVPALNLSFTAAKLPPLTFTGRDIVFAQDTSKLSITSFDIASDVGTLHAEGALETNASQGTLSVSSKGIDLKRLAALLKTAAPSLATMNLSGSLSTNMVVTLAGSAQPAVRGPISLRDINADLPGGQKVRGLNGELSVQGSPADLSINTSGLKFNFQELPLILATNARITQASIAVSSLSVKGLGGTINAPVTMQRSGNQAFSTQPTLATLSIGDLLKISQPSVAQTISGTITSATGNFSGNLSGDVARSISGPGDILVKDFVLKGANIPNLILTKVSGIPLLEGTLRSNIAPEHQKYFNDPDTKVKELKADYSLNGGVITLRTLTATSDAFTLESNGTMSMAGDLNLSSTFTLNAEISASLAKRSKTVTAMLNPKKMLAIPVVIQGRSPKLVVLPDISKLLQGAGGKLLEEKAGSLLEKALGGKKDGKGKKSPLGGVLGF